jgi:hypothetical protein
LGVSREVIVGGLRALGVPVSPAPFPAQREVDWGERTWFDRDDVQRVVDHLRPHIPPGTRWGFNYEGHRAWARAESSVDLEAIVRAAPTRQP